MSDIDQIKKKVPLVDIVAEYTKLEPAGKSFKARCPFHNEKSASFHVTPEEEVFYCFGCGKGGDVFTFIQEAEGLDFVEALKHLAERAGIELSGDRTKSTPTGYKDKLRRLLQDATRLYQITLRKTPEVVEYLTKRGLHKETITDFSIGYAQATPNYMLTYLRKKGYTQKECEDAGLVVQGKNGAYDRFRERIMFPIWDERGRVVGFSGRIYPLAGSRTDTTKVGKYVNTNDTILFNKSELLYGYNKAKKAMSQKDRTILVEGQVDLIMAHQAGSNESIAISGTALTPDHVRKIERFTDHVILALDGDSAGVRAARRSIEILYDKGMTVSVALLPEGKDPADVIHENQQEWKDSIASAKEYMVLMTEKIKKVASQRKELRKLLEGDIYPFLMARNQPIENDKVLIKIAHNVGVSEKAAREDYENWKGGNVQKPVREQSPPKQEPQHVKNDAERTVTTIIALGEILGEQEKIKGEIQERIQGDGLNEMIERAEKDEQTKAKIKILHTNEKDAIREKIKENLDKLEIMILERRRNDILKRVRVERENEEVKKENATKLLALTKRIDEIKNKTIP